MTSQLIYRGTNQSATGVVRNQDGSPYNLTGKTVEFFIKVKGSPIILFFKAGVVTATPTDGIYVIQFLPVDTVNIPDGCYDFGIQVRLNNTLVYAGGEEIQMVSPGGSR